MTDSGRSFLRSPDLWWPLAIFAALVGFKLLFVTGPTSGPTISDEDVYWRLSKILADGVFYQGTKYPPLYPAALAPAHLAGEAAYRIALVLNAFYSSLMVLPVYALGRILVSRRGAVAIALLAALVPYHYVLPRTMMSENLYFPLLMLAVFMVVWRPKRGIIWFDLLTGVVLAGLYLTRYVSLAVIPALGIAWWLREWEHTGKWYLGAKAWLRLGAVFTGFVALFAPWVIIERGYGLSIKSALGFGVTSTTNPEQLTLDRLSWYVSMYAAYFVMLATPVLGLLASVPQTLRREKLLGVYARFTWLAVLLSVSFLAALSRHSWRAAYNYPDPLRIMGRYAIYLAVIYLLLAFATLVRWERTGSLLGHLVSTVALPVTLLAVCYMTVLGPWVLPITDAMITDRGSVDAFRMQLMGPWYWVIGVAALVGVALALWHRDRRTAVWTTAAATALFLLVGAPTYMAELQRHQLYVEHAHRILDAAEESGVEPPVDVHVTASVRESVGFSANIVERGMRLNVRVPEPVHVRIYVEPGSETRDAHIILQKADETDTLDSRLLQYRVEGEEFVIVENQEYVHEE